MGLLYFGMGLLSLISPLARIYNLTIWTHTYVSVKYKSNKHRSMTQKQVVSILELLQLNPVYYLDATKAQAQCLCIISSSAKRRSSPPHKAVYLWEQNPHFHFVVSRLKTFGESQMAKQQSLKTSRPALDSN